MILFVFILFERHLKWELQAPVTFFLLLTLVNCGAILEQRGWIFYPEYSRAIVFLTAVLLYYPSMAISALALMPLPLVFFSTTWKTVIPELFISRK